MQSRMIRSVAIRANDNWEKFFRGTEVEGANILEIYLYSPEESVCLAEITPSYRLELVDLAFLDENGYVIREVSAELQDAYVDEIDKFKADNDVFYHCRVINNFDPRFFGESFLVTPEEDRILEISDISEVNREEALSIAVMEEAVEKFKVGLSKINTIEVANTDLAWRDYARGLSEKTIPTLPLFKYAETKSSFDLISDDLPHPNQ